MFYNTDTRSRIGYSQTSCKLSNDHFWVVVRYYDVDHNFSSEICVVSVPPSFKTSRKKFYDYFPPHAMETRVQRKHVLILSVLFYF